MKKLLTPEKIKELVLIALVTTCVVSVIFLYLIQPEYEHKKELARKTVEAQSSFDDIMKMIKLRDSTATDLATVTKQIAMSEEDIASGDVYSWTYDTLRRFKSKYPLDIPNLGQPVISDVDLIGEIPYRQLKVPISGSGFYHDIGRFIADFENNFPHIRVVNLSLIPGSNIPGTTAERLTFRMDVIALVKLNN